MQTITTESKRIMVLVPRRKRLAAVIKNVKKFNRFFDLGCFSDMLWFYGAVIGVLIGGAISVNAIIQALLLK
jgi:hypothetical protein